MATPLRYALAVFLVFTCRASGQQAATSIDRFVGIWEGTLDASTRRLRVALTVERDATAGLRGDLTAIDQGNMKIPGAFAVHGDTLVVTLRGAGAVYTGVITAAHDSLRGTYEQGTRVPLGLKRVAAIAPLVNRPQEPKPPFPYRAQEVAFESAPGVRLAGTLIIPPGIGPFPAVVMVTGSGPQDRDETLMGHKPFLVIADYLARRGIASLRYDDRGTAKSTGDFARGTTADFANDAGAAVRFLRGIAAVSRDRIGILGHSEGGVIAAMVASRSSDAAFVVLLAAPGIAGDSFLDIQNALSLAAAGWPEPQINRLQMMNRRMFAAVKAGGDSATIMAAARDVYPRLPPEMKATLTADSVYRRMTRTLTPWMRYFITYDPRPAFRRVTVPVLALNGTLDVQVPYKESLAAIDAALKAAGNKDYRVVELAKLNHLFQTAETGAVSEYSKISETISPAALDLIATWIAERFARR